jgi:2-polyprenyl-6-methoxyphenol hydroxylase-like FAD-dependent oxidoreductase
MVDALTLIRQLKRTPSLGEALRTYESLRLREVKRFQRFSHTGAAVREWSWRPQRLVRDTMLRLLNRSDWARRRQVALLSGM